MASLVALFCALRFDATTLAPGELAVIPLLAADRRQARIVMSYLRSLCQLPTFHPYVHRVLREGIELHTAVNVEISTASFRTIRGFTMPAAVLDEVAFWRDESTSTNPDSEILDALRPCMSTVPDALLFAISSPYARRGELFSTYERYFGQDDRFTLVWNSDTQSLNPTVASRVIERAYEKDQLRLQYSQSGKDPKSRQSRTGEPGPVYPPFPVLSAKDDLPAGQPDRPLPLQDEPCPQEKLCSLHCLGLEFSYHSQYPNKGEQLVRYYGYYSNVSRGKRKKEKVEEEPTEVTEVPPSTHLQGVKGTLVPLYPQGL